MKSSIWNLSLVLLVGLGLARAQAGPGVNSPQPAVVQPAAQPVPDYVIYRMFFSHVVEREKMAAQLESQGRNADDFRDHDWKAAGLTADEGSIMKGIALDCIQALSDLSEHMKAELAGQGVTPSSNVPPPRAPGSDPLRPYETRGQIVDDHIAQLRRMLGDESFAKLDKYIRSLLGATGPNTPAPNPYHLPEPVPNVPVNPNVPAQPGATSTSSGK